MSHPVRRVGAAKYRFVREMRSGPEEVGVIDRGLIAEGRRVMDADPVAELLAGPRGRRVCFALLEYLRVKTALATVRVAVAGTDVQARAMS